ncbi:putative manganese-dependent inorganic diphosphatase [Pectinatus brassicae]|uniref:inorganic diphosphatase n=1 Tax=Pectinatus brassicae TaxID=862415 RepID=A0A840UYA2_9FIRM|nr:putative manganese-dependent inorganic diphosphatase [Pectinatus brassicae]MBB5337355.1 manganese-dependent inorganic pyrophosphatase [Pectinatus brassicae]
MREKKPIYVIGHRNPDTDSICSAISYADLKKNLGENVVPARAGKINKETEFALKYFDVQLPELVADVYPRVSDILPECHSIIGEHDNLRKLGKMMRETSVKSIPVVNDDNELAGIVTVSDLANRYFEDLGMQSFSNTKVTISDILSVIDGDIVVDGDKKKIVDGDVRIAAGSLRMIEEIIKQNDVVLVGDRVAPTLKACLEKNIACLIVTGSGHIPTEIIEAAQENMIMVLVTPYDTYTCGRLINQCVPVSRIMQKDVTAFKPTDMLSDIKGIMEQKRFRNYPVVENNRVVGMLSSDKLMVPDKTQLILVDHNERTQAVEGIEEAQILEIIDHHRLGGLQTGEPIFTRQDRMGCTSTIIADMYFQYDVKIPQKIAGLMVSAIISDTVLFKSPTCTPHDKKIAEKLAEIAGIDINKYGMELLKAGSDVGNMTAMEIVKNDLKEFQLGDRRIVVSQTSVMDSEDILKRQGELLKNMEALCAKDNYDMCLVMITNILNEATNLLFTGEPRTLIGEAFKKDASGNMVYLPGVMSRKKQIIPQITEAAKKYTNN